MCKVSKAYRTGLFVCAVKFVFFIRQFSYLLFGHAPIPISILLHRSPSDFSMQFVQIHDQPLVKLTSSWSLRTHLIYSSENIVSSFLNEALSSGCWNANCTARFIFIWGVVAQIIGIPELVLLTVTEEKTWITHARASKNIRITLELTIVFRSLTYPKVFYKKIPWKAVWTGRARSFSVRANLEVLVQLDYRLHVST